LLYGVKYDTIAMFMSGSIDKLLAKMRQAPTGVRFADAIKVAGHYFGAA